MNGITEQTVADIFDYINKHEERAFVLKFSAIEIYNEAIRDLLSSDNTPLRLRDDPERGTIVEKVMEETLRDWNHFNDLVSICEAQRQIGETSLNERSSRSHQILRLTVESSAREFLGKDNSTTLAASVNFVDLAGSERASQSLSAGTRLKEGCHINRSLLTLGTVIRKLSKGRNGHINYRDSKLTRILQPALGGNARTAIICTLSPARSHVEQTRNTLLFACCAKEVTTKAQVNVVMSDKALVKHLQKELARLENELRCPATASSNCDYAALLRKKDLQIEKMGKEIRELTKQRDLAQSRVEDLLRLVGDDRDTRKPVVNGNHPNWQAEETWDDDCSELESSLVVDSYGQNIRMKRLNGTYSNGVTEENFLSDDSRSLPEGTRATNGEEDPDEYCKDVRCIEMEELIEDNTMESGVNGGVASQNTSAESNENGDTTHTRNLSNYGALEQRLNDVQRTIDSLVDHPDGPSSEISVAEDVSSSTNFKLSRSRSCRDNALNRSSLGFEEGGNSEATPLNEFQKDFPGRPEGVRRFLPLNYSEGVPRLSRNDSQSSVGTASIAPSIGPNGDEDITSVQTFVAGMKEMANDYEKQLAEKDSAGRNVKDVALDPMQESVGDSTDWPVEFARLQKRIIELWQACNVPLIHRTYFFLLFRGDPTDSIYMEVELRRLTFMKEMFADGGQAVANGRTITLASSLKALQREREKLSRLMRRRFSEEARERLFEKWGIGLGTKRRRLQLANRLWSEIEDMDHVMESASIIAKLVRFTEQGHALKGMLGLSFSTPPSRRRSFGWKNSMASLL
ncbi:kinesin-like protein KIN-7E isoform X2 [Punica granatum]|nr:kinesin-like protein KIN-7E isoform X2 [Punica granatum]